MGKLTTREKGLIGFCGVVAIVVLGLLVFRPLVNQWRTAGEELIKTQQDLEVAEKLVDFESSAIALEKKLRKKTGLEGEPLISNEQFEQIQEHLTVDATDTETGKDNINTVGKRQLLNLGFDKYLVNSILAYRNKVGKFDELKQLKDMRGSIFEGELAEAIISKRISEKIRETGVERIDKLDAKPASGKKKEDIPKDAKKLFVKEVYLNELETEMKTIAQRLDNPDASEDSKPAKSEKREFPALPADIPDELKEKVAKSIIALGGDFKLKSREKEGDTQAQAENNALKDLDADKNDVYVTVLDKGKKGIPVLGLFAKPVKVRVTMKEDEQGIISKFREAIKEYNEELAYADEEYYDDDYYDDGYYDDGFYDDGFYDDSDWDDAGDNPENQGNENEENEKNSSNEENNSHGENSNIEVTQESAAEEGESETGENSEIAQETPDENDVSGENDFGEGDTGIDEAEIAQEMSDESDISGESDIDEEDVGIDEEAMVSKLVNYLVAVSQTKDELQDWLDNLPTSYQKEYYIVDIAFKCKLDQLVNFIYKAESSYKWLSVRSLKISIADQKKNIISANISFVATVL